MSLITRLKSGAGLGLFCLFSCSDGTGEERWHDQLVADGPCWQVDLSDGLNEERSDEVHALYQCLNQRGEFEDLVDLDLAMDSPSRTGLPLGAEVGRGVNQAAELEIDLIGISGPMLDLLEDDTLLPSWLHIATELILGQSWASMGEDPESISDPSAGPVPPVLSVLQRVATLDLDGSIDLMGRLGNALSADIVLDGVCSLIRLDSTQNTELQDVQASILPHLGEALEKAHDSSNDHWSEASGDSVRDLAETLALAPDGGTESPLQQAQPHLESLLTSTALQYQLEDVLTDAHDQGQLSPLIGQLKVLASMDTDGGTLSSQEDSAWVALLRLVARGNTEVSCSINLILIELEIELGNLSVEILRSLAQRNPETASSGISLLGSVLGTTLTQASLDAIAFSGLCPALDTQMVDDLASIDRLDDDNVDELLIVMIHFLSALHDAGNDDDLIEDFVDVLTILYEGNVADSSQELLRDIGDTDLATDLGVITGMLLDQTDLNTGTCPTDSQPLSFETLWNSLSNLLATDSGEDSLPGMQPIVEAIVQGEETWTAIDRLTPLLKDEEATLARLPSLLAQTLDSESTEVVLGPASAFLTSPEVTVPLLHVTESQAWTQALQSENGPTGGPLSYIADLVLSGTLEALLRRTQRLIDLSRDLVSESTEQ